MPKLNFLKKKKNSKEKPLNLIDNISENTTVSSLNKDFRIKSKNKNLRHNLRQSEDKLETQLETNLRQSGCESNNKKDKLETQLETKLETNLRQSEDKLETNLKKTNPVKRSEFNLFSTTGIQRKILLAIFNSCQFSLNKISPPISIDYLNLSLKIQKSSIRKTIQRLEKKGFIIRSEFKNGRGGWTKYSLPESVYNQLLQDKNKDKLETNLRQSEDKLETQLETQLETHGLNNNSSLNKSNTIITANCDEIISSKNQSTLFGLPEEWEAIDIEVLSEIKFTRNHLQQLYKKSSLPLEVIEDSLHAYAFDLFENGLIETIKTPLKMIMGLLIKGQPYNSPDNYESPKDRALRLYYDKKRREEDERGRKTEELKDIEYRNWTVSLSDAEKDSFLSEGYKKLNPESTMAKKIMEADLKAHFLETVWPEKMKDILKM